MAADVSVLFGCGRESTGLALVRRKWAEMKRHFMRDTIT